MSRIHAVPASLDYRDVIRRTYPAFDFGTPRAIPQLMKKTNHTKFSTDASKFKTKAEMINELVELVEGWDLETLVEYAKACRRMDLESSSTFEVAASHITMIGGSK